LSTGCATSSLEARRFVSTSQFTRAASSVAANIAEGNGRGTKKDYASFVSIAKGSLNEAETYILLASRLRYITESEAEEALGLCEQVGRMLVALRRSLLN
jgi:four helix bundle protein